MDIYGYIFLQRSSSIIDAFLALLASLRFLNWNGSLLPPEEEEDEDTPVPTADTETDQQDNEDNQEATEGRITKCPPLIEK